MVPNDGPFASIVTVIMINKKQLTSEHAPALNLSQLDLRTSSLQSQASAKERSRILKRATIPHERTLRDVEQTLTALGIEFHV